MNMKVARWNCLDSYLTYNISMTHFNKYNRLGYEKFPLFACKYKYTYCLNGYLCRSSFFYELTILIWYINRYVGKKKNENPYSWDTYTKNNVLYMTE